MASDGGPIFIGGTGRSGTTVLTRILHWHSHVHCIRWESQFLVDPEAGLISVASKGFRRGGMKKFLECLRGRWFQRTSVDGSGRTYHAGLVHDVSEEDRDLAIDILHAGISNKKSEPLAIIRDFCHALFGPMLKRSGKQRWCEKTPANILYSHQLSQIFPNMKFLHIIRDGRDVVSSMIERRFWPIARQPRFPETQLYAGPVEFEKAVDYWKTMLHIARREGRLLSADQYLELRFEDLIQDLDDTLQKVCDFLDLPFDEAMKKQNLRRPNLGRWEKDLSADQLQYFYQHAGDTLIQEGYAA